MLLKFGGTDDKAYTNNGITIITNEGKVAINEAIAFLNAATPVVAIKWDQLLSAAARDLAVA
jgi:hypothetical protein